MPVEPFELFLYTINPSVLHRDLTPDRLTHAADERTKNYAAKQPDERAMMDAVTIGALRGAAFSRRYLNALTAPTDAFFGARSGMNPNLTAGAVPFVLELPAALAVLGAVPIVTGAGRAAISVLKNPINTALPTGRGIDVQAWHDMTFLMTYSTASLLTIPLMVATTACHWSCCWVSASVKLAMTAPLALLGAAAGAALHTLYKKPVELVGDFGARGARNEETVAANAPVSAIPEHFFFLTEDRFGLDVRELLQFQQARGSLINPHTNSHFSAADVQRLACHPTGWFTRTHTARLEGATLLSAALWHKYFDYFTALALAWGHTGPNADRCRQDGCNSLKSCVQRSEPAEALALKLFFQTLSDAPWAEMLERAENDAAQSEELAVQLLRIMLNVGAPMMSYDTCMSNSGDGLGQPQEVGFLEAMGPLIALLRKTRFAGSIELGCRHPWIAKLGLSAEDWQRLTQPKPSLLEMGTAHESA